MVRDILLSQFITYIQKNSFRQLTREHYDVVRDNDRGTAGT
jgi:hypothetical protein